MNGHRVPRLLGTALVAFLVCLANVARASETIIYSEGFEANNGNYTLNSGTDAMWQWGTPAAAIGPATAHSGTRCWGTNLSGAIPRTCDASIMSPAIQLPATGANQLIRVRFWAYVDIDGMYDRGEFFVSKDSTTWQSLLRMYNTMGFTAAEPPAWHKYEFTLDPSYSGSTLYLRFRAGVPYVTSTFYCGGAGTLSGIYVDDIAVSLLDNGGASKVFSMNAWEDNSPWASCPWIAPWDGANFTADNDVYSVARGAAGEFTDYYRLNAAPVALNGAYALELGEKEQEDSYTDYVSMLEVDHAADVSVAPDNNGNLFAYRPAALVAPQSAVSSAGQDVLAAVASADGQGFAAYDGDAVVVDFGNASVTGGATLVLGVTGFVPGSGAERPFTGPPAVVVETRDAAGQWQERGRLNPRFKYSVAAFDLSSYLAAGAMQVRLRSVSHSIKYHLVDYVALQSGPAPAFTSTAVAPTTATFGPNDILAQVGAADGNRFKMSAGQAFRMTFPILPLAPGQSREFVFVSKGYYIPKGGSYLVYTWDGSAWVLRDSYTYPASNATHNFDLSPFLPDPNGEYRVRVWQDYQWDGAGIDYVAMNATSGVTSNVPLSTAVDYHYSPPLNIFSTVQALDGVQESWSGCPRDRLTEYFFSPPPVINRPPSTCPVTATNARMPNICWTFADLDGDGQSSVEIQIWTNSGRNGTNVWNPAPIVGTATCAAYTGTPLAPGTYYVSVRATDNRPNWNAVGPWCEGSFTVPSNLPPVASGFPVAGIDSVCAGDSLVLNTSFGSPEAGQVTTTSVNLFGLANASVTSVDGNTSTQHLVFRPVASQAGTHLVRYMAVDNGSPAETTTVDVTLLVKVCSRCLPGNRAPQFVSGTPTCGTTNQTYVQQALTLTFKAMDADAQDIVTLSASGLPAGAVLSPALPATGNPVTATLTWTPAVSDTGLYAITLKAGDTCDSTVCTFYVDVLAAALCPKSADWWEDHRPAWPVDSLRLGQRLYGPSSIARFLEEERRGRRERDGDVVSLRLARELVAAKFNVIIGAYAPGVNAMIQKADSLIGNRSLPFEIECGGRGYHDAAMAGGVTANPAPNCGGGGGGSDCRQQVAMFELVTDWLMKFNTGRFTPDCRGGCRGGGRGGRHMDDDVAATNVQAGALEFSVVSRPNPFRGSTVIAYTLPKEANVRIAIYDLQGRELRVLTDGRMAAGQHELPWDGTGANGQRLTGGVYFYRVTADQYVSGKKLIVQQ